MSSFFPFLNFAIFIYILVYALRKTMLKDFVKQKEEFLSKVKKAEEELELVLQKLNEAKLQQAKLEVLTKDLLKKAQQDAEKEKERILAEAQVLANKMAKQAEIKKLQEIAFFKELLTNEVRKILRNKIEVHAKETMDLKQHVEEINKNVILLKNYSFK